MWRCLRDPTFSRFSRTPTCDRQADTRLGRRAVISQSRARPLITNRSKALENKALEVEWPKDVMGVACRWWSFYPATQVC